MSAAAFKIWYPDGRTEDRLLGIGQHDVGRTTGALILDDASVSSRHARITVEAGRVSIEDLGSSNGTTDPQGRRLQAPFVMQPQQPLLIGSTRITLISISATAPGTQLLPVMGGPPAAHPAGFAPTPIGFVPASGYGAPPAYGPPPARSDGVPPGYAPPAPQYAAPPGYGPPPAQSYGAPPSAGYGPPPGAGHGPAAMTPWQGGPAGVSPAAPFGIDPISGLPYSDKSKLVAGLLQLFFGSLAVGRFYMGNTGLALAQMANVFIIGVGGSFFTCGGSLLVMLWPAIDGIIILTGKPVDAQGRPLRP